MITNSNEIPYNGKYWQSLHLVIWPQSDGKKFLAKFKFGGGTSGPFIKDLLLFCPLPRQSQFTVECPSQHDVLIFHVTSCDCGHMWLAYALAHWTDNSMVWIENWMIILPLIQYITQSNIKYTVQHNTQPALFSYSKSIMKWNVCLSVCLSACLSVCLSVCEGYQNSNIADFGVQSSLVYKLLGGSHNNC